VDPGGVGRALLIKIDGKFQSFFPIFKISRSNSKILPAPLISKNLAPPICAPDGV
jgi:hypothetical protein